MEGVYKVISFQKMSKSLLWLVWCCVLALPPGTDTIASESKSDLSHNEAIVRLSRVFGIDRVPIPRRHRSPPQYMVDLYHSVAYQDGITKNRSPYGSDVVRSLPDRDTKHQMHFYFNISYIKRFEKILEAEFHIFKLRPRPPSGITSIPRGVHIIELKLYQVLDEDRMYRADGVRLLDHRRISAHQYGWEVFKVRDTVQQWVNDNRQNLGFLVTATSSRGTPVNGTYVRFAQRSEHHDSKQPNLVVFTEDDKHAHKTLVTPSDADFITDPLDDEEESSEFREPVHGPITRQTYIQFLNEGVRAKHANNLRLFPNKQNFNSTLYRNTGYRRSKRSLRNTRQDRSSKRGRRSKGDTKDYYQFPRKRKQTCSKHELYVDFDEIGWSGWIISPKGYNAFHCKGECPFPLGQNQKPTNHATVQSIVHALRIGKDVGTPCCVPNKLYSISLLYFDDDENVILKQYDDMVAASCGCH